MARSSSLWDMTSNADKKFLLGLGRGPTLSDLMSNPDELNTVAALNREPSGTQIESAQQPEDQSAEVEQSPASSNSIALPGMSFTAGPDPQMTTNARRYQNDNDPRVANVDGTKPGQKVVQDDTKAKKDVSVYKAMVNPEEFNKALAAYKDTDEYKQQLASINNLEQLSLLATGAPDKNAAWLKPLIALTDSQTGSHLMSGYEPGLSPKDRNTLILKYADELAKRRNDQASEARKAALGLLGDTVTNQLLQKAGLLTQISGDSPSKNMMERQDRQDHRTAVNNLQKNPVIQKQLLTSNSIATGFDQIDKMELTSPQQVAEAMQVVRNATTGLTGGAKSGVTERVETYMPNIWRGWQNLVQKYNGSVENIPNNDPQLVQIKKELVQASKSINKEFWALVDAATGGFSEMYKRRDDLKESLLDLTNSYRSLVGNKPGMSNKEIDAKAAAATKKQAAPVNTGGDPGMDAFLKSRGGK